MRNVAGTFKLLGAFAKLRSAINSFVMHFCLSVRPHGTTQFAIDELSRNVIFDYFSKILRVNASFTKIWQEQRALYMKTYLQL
jgi:hypothetical protein